MLLQKISNIFLKGVQFSYKENFQDEIKYSLLISAETSSIILLPQQVQGQILHSLVSHHYFKLFPIFIS